ncbi:MAG: hypothetical protein AB7E95_09565 [Kiritimatiellales bacterium]
MKRKWIVPICFALYFGTLLVPKFIPQAGFSFLMFWLGLSLIFIIPLLLLLAVWSVIALVIAWVRKRPVGKRSKNVGQFSLIGISMLITFFMLTSKLPSSLPTGSYDEKFDQTTWLAPYSADYVDGDITPRQKMLADVIKNLPGKTISEIENMLGPSLDSPYFKSTGRNLIYITGPERDSLFGIDSEWLLIWVDDNGIYRRYEITTD